MDIIFNHYHLRGMMVEEWITTEEACQISGYHAETLRELLREGKIEGKKFGPVWQVNRASLNDYLKRMEKSGNKRGPKLREQNPRQD